MREVNYNLALMALVCKCYHKDSSARILMHDAELTDFAELEIPSQAMVHLFNAAGLIAMAWVAPPRAIPPAIQSMADRDQLVLVEMHPLDGMRYKTWGVLEKSTPEEIRILSLWKQTGTQRYASPLEHHMTGHIVVMAKPIQRE